MKIAILTQPLHNNYGGILQNFALQHVLKSSNFQVVTINYVFDEFSLLFKIKKQIRNIILGSPNRNLSLNGESFIKKTISKYTSRFIKDHIELSEKVYSTRKLFRLVDQYDPDIIIVGSDQVWRPSYSPGIFNFFLEFWKREGSILISYAASFGVSRWEFTLSQSQKIRKLLNRFHAISVRENEGKQLLLNNLNIDSVLVLDPTLLLDPIIYRNLYKDKTSKKSDQKYIFIYALDSKKEILDFIRSNKILSSLKIVDFMPKSFKDNVVTLDNIDEFVYPPVEDWLWSIDNAEYVLTDSFHGTVFSILFRKKFLALANIQRGASRFESILSLLNLNDRISYDLINSDFSCLNKEIDYEDVFKLINRQKKESIKFLKNSTELANK